MRSRNIPIDIVRGTSKDVTIVFDDEPTLVAATITFTAKMYPSDADAVLVKTYDMTKSNSLATGKFVLSFSPADTQSLEARTYTYEIKVAIDDVTYRPLIGDFCVYSNVTS